MTTLIPKIDFKNGGTTPTGAINRAFNLKVQEVVSVKDFGATGDGTTDDYASISACIAYCTTAAKTVYFPSGNYKISAGLVFTDVIGVDCDSRTTITAVDNTFNTITFSHGNYAGTITKLPQIVNGLVGVLMYGTTFLNLTVPNVTNCIDAIVLRIDNTYKGCADNIVNFTAISTSTSGIKFDCQVTSSFAGTLFQGNQFTGNFIVNCKYPIHFYDVNNGSIGFPTWDDTQFNIFAIDSASITGSIGIYGEPSLPPSRCIYNVYGFFDLFDVAYIKGNGIGNIFKLAFSGQPAYAKMKLTGAANRVINTSQGQENWIPADAIQLSTAVNSISTFNGGVPISANRFLGKITIPAGFVSGTIVQAFFYHPLMTNYMPKVTAQLWSNQTMRILWASECSTAGISDPGGNAVYPFQGSIAVIGEGAVAAGNYFVWITVHDAPQ
jgi:hypothetical protein